MSSNEWKTYKLKEIADLRKEQVMPNGKEQVYIGLEHIEQQTLRLNGVGSSKDVSSNKFQFYSNDILYGKLRPYFRKVYHPKFSGVCSTDIFVFKNRNNVDNAFLYYLLATEEFTRIANSGSTGTHMPRADWSQLAETEWFIPTELDEQNRIASILSSLDYKIENNLQINQTLEEIARTLFYEMCLPKGDELPEGWRVGKLGEIYKTTSGGTPSRDKSEYYVDGVINWVKSKELGGFYVLDTEERITEIALRNSSAKLLPVNSILIAMYGATVGEVSILGKQATCNQAICAILPNDEYPYSFIHELIKSQKLSLKNMAVGAAQQNISQVVIQGIEIIIPDVEQLKEFHSRVEPIYNLIKKKIEENQTLKEIRDSLLPKLMSGEIEVNV